MCKFDEEVKVFYDRFDKAYENNDIAELGYFSQFCIEKDIRKWVKPFLRRQICENALHWQKMQSFGYTEVILNDVGWLEWKFKNYKDQEFVPLGEEINRGCCNMKESKAIAILQVPNGNWVAKVSQDFSCIGSSYICIGANSNQYPNRTEAWNAALKEYIASWHKRNPQVEKEDKAVRKAKSLIITQIDFFSELPPMPRKEPIQLELF